MDSDKSKETTTTNNEVGNQPETDSLIERADKAAERLEAANKEKEELLNREEQLLAQRKLGGSARAGDNAEKPKEESPLEYSKRVMSGELNAKSSEEN